MNHGSSGGTRRSVPWRSAAMRQSPRRRWPPPNPAMAANGQRLHPLERDPLAAPIVQRISTEYLSGRGFYNIAERLTRASIPSAAEHDPARYRHRDGRAWLKSAVRAILSTSVLCCVCAIGRCLPCTASVARTERSQRFCCRPRPSHVQPSSTPHCHRGTIRQSCQQPGRAEQLARG